jgi:thioredoxin 1
MQKAVLATTKPTVAHARTAIRKPLAPLRAVVDSSSSAFAADVIDASNATPVIVDFHAAWCGPCKLVAPSMVWADKEYDGKLKVVKIDCTDGNKDLMEQYKVYGLPCLIMFNGGAMIEGSLREGAITKKALAEYIQQWTGGY